MYEFDIAQAVKEIRAQKAKKVLLHLPDGLKPRTKEMVDELRKKTSAEIMVWAGSCYGACDIPVEAKNVGVDLIMHFGHTKWKN